MSGLDTLRLGGLACIAAASLSAATASPCDGVERSLAKDRATVLARAVAGQLHLTGVNVLQSFRDAGWEILYVDTHRSDETFLFYPADPATRPAVTSWSGGASPDEEPGIRHWLRSHAPGIPARLAACFAWHVARDRDM